MSDLMRARVNTRKIRNVTANEPTVPGPVTSDVQRAYATDYRTGFLAPAAPGTFTDLNSIFVNPTTGNDANTGTLAAKVRTLRRARELVVGARVRIVLDGGVYEERLRIGGGGITELEAIANPNTFHIQAATGTGNVIIKPPRNYANPILCTFSGPTAQVYFMPMDGDYFISSPAVGPMHYVFANRMIGLDTDAGLGFNTSSLIATENGRDLSIVSDLYYLQETMLTGAGPFNLRRYCKKVVNNPYDGRLYAMVLQCIHKSIPGAAPGTNPNQPVRHLYRSNTLIPNITFAVGSYETSIQLPNAAPFGTGITDPKRPISVNWTLFGLDIARTDYELTEDGEVPINPVKFAMVSWDLHIVTGGTTLNGFMTLWQWDPLKSGGPGWRFHSELPAYPTATNGNYAGSGDIDQSWNRNAHLRCANGTYFFLHVPDASGGLWTDSTATVRAPFFRLTPSMTAIEPWVPFSSLAKIPRDVCWFNGAYWMACDDGIYRSDTGGDGDWVLIFTSQQTEFKYIRNVDGALVATGLQKIGTHTMLGNATSAYISYDGFSFNQLVITNAGYTRPNSQFGGLPVLISGRLCIGGNFVTNYGGGDFVPGTANPNLPRGDGFVSIQDRLLTVEKGSGAGALFLDNIELDGRDADLNYKATVGYGGTLQLSPFSFEAWHVRIHHFCAAVRSISTSAHDSIFEDCFDGIDVHGILALESIPRYDRQDTVGNNKLPHIAYNIFRRIERVALSGPRPLDSNSKYYHNTFYECAIRFDHRDRRKLMNSAFFATIPTTQFLDFIDNLMYKGLVSIHQNHGNVRVTFTLWNGSSTGTILPAALGTAGYGNIGPSQGPTFIDRPDNLRLIWAGYDALNLGILPVEDSYGAFASSDVTDMGAYHRGQIVALQMEYQDLEFESPPGTTWAGQALQAESVEGKTVTRTFQADQTKTIALDYSGDMYSHARNRAAHSLMAVRASRVAVEFYTSIRRLLPVGNKNGRDVRDLYAVQWETFQAALQWGASIGKILVQRSVLNDEETIESFPVDASDFPLDANWLDGMIALVTNSQRFDKYESHGEIFPEEFPNTYLIQSSPTFSIEEPSQNRAIVLTELHAEGVFPAGQSRHMQTSVGRWLGLCRITYADDFTLSVELLGSGSAVPIPYLFDRWIIAIQPANRITDTFTQIDVTGDSSTFDGVIKWTLTPWTLEPWESTCKLWLRGNPDGTYKATPLGISNPLALTARTQYRSIKAATINRSIFGGIITSAWIDPDRSSDISVTHDGAGERDVWFTHGAEWAHTRRTEGGEKTRIGVQQPSLGNAGFSQPLILSAPPRDALSITNRDDGVVNDFTLTQALQLLSGRTINSGLTAGWQLWNGASGGISAATILRARIPLGDRSMTFRTYSTNPALLGAPPPGIDNWFHSFTASATVTIESQFADTINLNSTLFSAIYVPDFEESGPACIVYADPLKIGAGPLTGNQYWLVWDGDTGNAFDIIAFFGQPDYALNTWSNQYNATFDYGFVRFGTSVGIGGLVPNTAYYPVRYSTGHRFVWKSVSNKWFAT